MIFTFPFDFPGKFPSRTLALLTMLMLSACATVEKRIEANATLFESYPAEVQESLRKGQIDLGYSMKMVEIAKGKPRYINRKKTPDGEFTVWRYMRSREYSRTLPVYDIDSRGTDWVNVTESEELEVLRVEFRNGEVLSFEEMQSGR